MDSMIQEIDGKIYATAQAYVVEGPEQLPREMAAEFKREEMNPSFIWIAGRYVQANEQNRNGQYWTFDDIQKGERSIQYTPLNALHRYDRPVGVIVQTKIVQREAAGESRLLPEVQALSVMWGANFPELAALVRAAHASKKLWYSMECVAESRQCLTCEEIYPWAAASHEVCEHLGTNKSAPRRFINPTFLGGALIFPPESPGWADADISEVARKLTHEYAARSEPSVTVEEWQKMMDLVISSS